MLISGIEKLLLKLLLSVDSELVDSHPIGGAGKSIMSFDFGDIALKNVFAVVLVSIVFKGYSILSFPALEIFGARGWVNGLKSNEGSKCENDSYNGAIHNRLLIALYIELIFDFFDNSINKRLSIEKGF